MVRKTWLAAIAILACLGTGSIGSALAQQSTAPPAAESGLNSKDPRLAIQWPLPVAGLATRDAAHPLLDDDFAGLAP